MMTPMKNYENTSSYKSLKLKSVHFSLLKFYDNCFLIGLVIFIASLVKFIFPLTREWVGKASFITGLPILRNHFFILPVLLTLLFFIQIVLIYMHEEISNSMDNNIWKYFNKTRFGYLFTNMFLFSFFYFIYHFLYLPL